MKKLLTFAFLSLAFLANAQSNIFSPPWCVTSAPPTFHPGPKGCRVAIDTNTQRLYIWKVGTTWVDMGDRIQHVLGCSAPLYIPNKWQSKVVYNDCNPRQLFVYQGAGVWDEIGADSPVITDATLEGDGSLSTPLKIAQQAATLNQVLKWNGTTWAPAADAGTTYTGGTGIDVTGTVISNTGDLSATNELITGFGVNSGSLVVSDAGGNFNVPLTNIAPLQDITPGAGISISGTSNKTITNTGVLGSIADQQVAVGSGSAISGSANFKFSANKLNIGSVTTPGFLGSFVNDANSSWLAVSSSATSRDAGLFLITNNAGVGAGMYVDGSAQSTRFDNWADDNSKGFDFYTNVSGGSSSHNFSMKGGVVGTGTSDPNSLRPSAANSGSKGIIAYQPGTNLDSWLSIRNAEDDGVDIWTDASANASDGETYWDIRKGTGSSHLFKIRRNTATSPLDVFTIRASDGYAGFGTTNPSSKLEITTNALGVTQSDIAGVTISTTTPAADGAQQISPAIRWRGQGWKQNAPAASQPVDFRAYVLPVQGTSAPSGTWILQNSINGGAYSSLISATSSQNIGILTTTPRRSLEVNGTFLFAGGIYDNRDNVVIQQSAAGITSNRDFTFGNTTYGRYLVSFKSFSFSSAGTHPALGSYVFYVNGDQSTSATIPSSIYFKSQSAQAGSGVRGGDFIIDFPVGDGAGRHGYFGLGTIAPDRAFHVEEPDSVTNAITYAQRLTHITSGTATTGFGTGVEMELENASGTNRVVATQEVTWSDAVDATEDATWKLRLIKDGALTDALTVLSSGFVGIGTSTPATPLNLKNGSMRIDKTDATPAVIGAYFNGSTVYGLRLEAASTSITSAPNGYLFQLGSAYSISHTSAGVSSVQIPLTFNPTSGTGIFNYLAIDNGVINQTGGANGITRGLYINPTLTSATDWRGLEIATAGSKGVYQSNSTPTNNFAGKTAFGSIGTPTEMIDVTGNGKFSGTVTGSNFISTATVRLKGYTVATLPTGVAGDIAYVTDALSPAYGVTVVGGGSVVTPVFFDGTNWTAR